MAIWEIEDESGQVFEIESDTDTPPTEAEIEGMLQNYGQDSRMEQIRADIAAQPSGDTKQFLQAVKDKGGIRNVMGEMGEQGLIGGKMVQALGGAADMAGAGVPSQLMAKAGIPAITPKTPGERAAKLGGQAVGFGAGVPGKVLKGGRALAGKMVQSNVLKDMAGMVAASAALTPDTPEGDLLNIQGRAINALVAAPLSGIGSAVGRTAQAFKPALSSKAMLQFENDIQNTLYNVKKAASDKFAKGLNTLSRLQPNKKVDLGDSLGKMMDVVDDSPAVKRLINKIPRLKSLMYDAKVDPQITIQEAQALKNQITQTVSKAYRGGRGATVTSEERAIMDVADDITADMGKAFPNLADEMASYAKTINPYNQIKGYMKFGKMLDTIKGNFKGDPQIINEAKKVLPPELIERIGTTSQAVQFMSYAKRTGLMWVVGLTAGGFGLKKMMGGEDGGYSGGNE